MDGRRRITSLRPSPAMVVAMVALFVALGGAAWAAIAPRNSVISSSIKNREVKTPDLARKAVTRSKLALGAVNGSRVANGSLSGADVADNSLGGADLNESSLGIVPNADRLDGLDSSQLTQGSGRVLGGAVATSPSSLPHVISTDRFVVSYFCPSDPPSENGTAEFFNATTGSEANLFADNGGTNPDFAGTLAFSGTREEPAAPGGEAITFQAQWPDGTIATVWVFSKHRASDCHVEAQALVTG